MAKLEPKGVYLRPLVGGGLPARASRGARQRALYLQAFLAPLQRAAERRFSLHGHVELWVLSADDWPRVTGAPYGWPLTRARPTVASAALAGGPAAMVLAAAHVPVAMLRRFEPLLLAAARGGAAVPPAAAGSAFAAGASVEGAPIARADARELVDLVIGHEWGHALGRLAGLRTGVRWVDELVATAVYLAALRETEAHEPLRRLLAWATVQVAAGGAAAVPAPPGRRPPTRPAGVPRDPATFELPRGRLRLAELLWCQGVLTERAWDLVDTEGWAFVERFGAALERGPAGRAGGIRDDAVEALAASDPGLQAWRAGLAEGPAGGG